MDRRRFGPTSIEVSSVGFGCGRIGGTAERFDRREALQILRQAFDQGINLFDTANIYAQGNSERLLAEAFAGRRSEIVIATKGGYRLSSTGSVAAKLKPLARRILKSRPGLNKRVASVRASQMSQDFSARSLEQALDGSLRRLRTDYVDLYQLHSPPPASLASGEAFEVLERLQREGKIRGYGVACLDPEDALRCLDVPGVAAVQIEASILRTKGLKEVLPAFSGSEIAVVARQPLAAGLLTREPGSWSVDDFHGDLHALDEARERMERLRSFGTPAAVGLRYLAQREGITSVLVATTHIEHLNEDIRALTSTPLSASEMRIISETL